MYRLLVEYKIDKAGREAYLAWMRASWDALDKSFSYYEGTDQPELFVEDWPATTEEEAQALKKERCSERSKWAEMTQWVPGGAPKVHAWVFRQASP